MDDITLTPLALADAGALYAFERANRAWFEAWVPARPEAYRTPESLAALIEEQLAGPDAMFLIRSGPQIVGRLNLTNIAEGAADLGYRVGEAACGRGVATEAVRLGLDAARSMGLTAINVRVKPDNPASAQVLAKSGFDRIGTEPAFHIFRRTLDDLARHPQVPAKGAQA